MAQQKFDLENTFERIVIAVLKVLLMLVIALAILELVALLVRAIIKLPETGINDIADVQQQVQRAFAGLLLVVLGLELFETLKTFFSEHRIRLEVILIVAIIAIARHIIQLDIEHLHGTALAGIAALVLALTGGYYLIKRASTEAGRASSGGH